MMKPEFFDDPDIAELSLAARLFFVGLWTQADRAGRLVDDVRRLKARIFPYDDLDVEALAVELHGKDMIRRYLDADGRGYIWIRSFEKHQRPHPKEPASVIPEWTTHAVKRNGMPCKNMEGTSESGSLVHGTRNPIDGDLVEQRFDRFWAVYPNKKGKDDARKAWRKRRPSEALTEIVLAAVTRQVRWPEWLKDGGDFIPHPATWLNRGSWDDEPKSSATRAPEFTEWVCNHSPRCPHRVACAVVSARPSKVSA